MADECILVRECLPPVHCLIGQMPGCWVAKGAILRGYIKGVGKGIWGGEGGRVEECEKTLYFNKTVFQLHLLHVLCI